LFSSALPRTPERDREILGRSLSADDHSFARVQPRLRFTLPVATGGNIVAQFRTRDRRLHDRTEDEGRKGEGAPHARKCSRKRRFVGQTEPWFILKLSLSGFAMRSPNAD
jgi:hypothetical protein